MSDNKVEKEEDSNGDKNHQERQQQQLVTDAGEAEAEGGLIVLGGTVEEAVEQVEQVGYMLLILIYMVNLVIPVQLIYGTVDELLADEEESQKKAELLLGGCLDMVCTYPEVCSFYNCTTSNSNSFLGSKIPSAFVFLQNLLC